MFSAWAAILRWRYLVAVRWAALSRWPSSSASLSLQHRKQRHQSLVEWQQ